MTRSRSTFAVNASYLPGLIGSMRLACKDGSNISQGSPGESGAEDADGRKSELNPLDAELAGRVCLDSNVLDK